MRNWLLALIVAWPLSLCAQAIVTVPPEQCIYKVGDDPRWAAADLDESGWKPFSEYALAGDMTVLWARCHTNVDLTAAQQPAEFIESQEAALQAFVNGRLVGRIPNSGKRRMMSTRRHGAGAAVSQQKEHRVGAWRSLVAHLHGVQGVPSSNLGAPTKFIRGP